jgi:hypothetical protein
VGPEEDFINHFNRYNYAQNNPVRYTDPDGRKVGPEKGNACSKIKGGGDSCSGAYGQVGGNAGVNTNNASAKSNDATTKAAGALVVGWGGAVTEPTPVGEAILGVLTLAATVYYGPELIEKMATEIDGLMKRPSGPDGVQYSLRATKDGVYPCYRCLSGYTNLKAGDVWKFGETTNPNSRYPAGYLDKMNLRQVNEVFGSQMQIKISEKIKIYDYYMTNSKLPPGNRIFR